MAVFISSLFLYIAENSIVWICHTQFINSPVDINLDYFQFFSVMNKASMKIL